MPELPEVEIMTRNTRRWLLGKSIRRLVVDDPRVLRDGAERVDALGGAVVEAVRRRAKHMVIQCGSHDLAVHFRMTGKVVRGPSDGKVRWSIQPQSGPSVDFKDARCLGELRLFPAGGADRWLQTLDIGPEPYPDAQTGGWWADRFAGARGAIKPALLDQRRVAGIGNILASEICWRASLNPRTPVADVSGASWDAVAAAVPALVDEVIATESGDEIVYVGESRDAGSTTFAVYAREGLPCWRCSDSGPGVARFKQAQRSTFWCPRCQVG